MGRTEEEVVRLGKRQQRVMEVIQKLARHELSMLDAQTMLEVKERTIWRYLKRQKTDPLFFVHGNSKRVPSNKKNPALKVQIQALMREKYFDFNLQHAREKIQEEIGIELKRETFRKWMHEIGLVKGPRKKRRRARYARDRMSQAGLLVLMDGSYHRWYGKRESCLVVAMDDATSEILHAEFCDAETTVDCLRVLRRVVESWGIFKALYVDQAGVFGSAKRAGFTQVERAMGELGTTVIYAQSPEAKGRIERLFRTLQDRLIPEMRIRGIKTRTDANEYLQKEFIPHAYRGRFTVIPHNPVAAFVPIHPKLDLSQIMIRKERRTIAKDHTFSMGAETYLITDELKYSIARHQIEIRWNEQGSGWYAFFAGRKLQIARFVRAKKIAA